MGHFQHTGIGRSYAPGWGRKPDMPGFRHAPITYPEEDGVPLGETESHIRAILHLFAVLDQFFRDRPDVYVGADLLMYYEEGDPSMVVVPDVFVAQGVIPGRGPRHTYKLWEEGAAPTLVIEVTSKSSQIEDLGTKRFLYERLGVKEYYVFDPLEEYLVPRLQGFFRVEDRLEPVPLVEEGSIPSAILGLDLVPQEDLLRLRDPGTNALLPTLGEETRRAQDESRRAQDETRRAQDESRLREKAEAEIARLHAELAQLRKDRQGQ